MKLLGRYQGRNGGIEIVECSWDGTRVYFEQGVRQSQATPGGESVFTYVKLMDELWLIAGEDKVRQSQKLAFMKTPLNIVKRLRRAEGHLRRVISMFDEGRSCLDLAQQLHAVEKAVGKAKRTLIHDHVDHCLDLAVSGPGKWTKPVVNEFKAISKYL